MICNETSYNYFLVLPQKERKEVLRSLNLKSV